MIRFILRENQKESKWKLYSEYVNGFIRMYSDFVIIFTMQRAERI